MPDLVGIMTYPGIDQILSGTFTLSHGITPSVCNLEIVPQADFIAEGGTLSIFFGDIEIDFLDCRIDTASFRYSPQGLIWGVSIWDRRWRWQWGRISGTYNERIPVIGQASIDAYTLATPQQLCALCLNAMGEVGYDVSQVPNNNWPEVRWDNDNPAQMLGQLADQLSCRIVLQLDNTVAVAAAGTGANLPSADLMQDALLFKPPQRPDVITVVGGKTRYQVDFALEAVGEDVDGTIRPIAQLSYTPVGGWGKSGSSPSQFGSVPYGVNVKKAPYVNMPPAVISQILQQNPRPFLLAQKTVFRWYRITTTALDGPGLNVIIPGWPGSRIQGIWQVLPIEDIQVQGFIDAEGVFRASGATVYGQYIQPGGMSMQPTPPGTVYNRGFSIDRERGIVMFEQYMTTWGPAQKSVVVQQLGSALLPPGLRNQPAQPLAQVVPAILFLRCAVSVRDQNTSAWSRYERSSISPGPLWGTQARILKHEEMVQSIVPIYNPDYSVKSTIAFPDTLDTEADYYLTLANLEYQIQTPQDRTYMGIIPISPDGAIQQVTWAVGSGGATTRASRNTEWHLTMPTYRERRAIDLLRLWSKDRPELLSLTRNLNGRQPPTS